MKKVSPQKRKDVLKKLLKSGNAKQYLLFFKKYHEADIADTLEELSITDRLQFFTKVDPEFSAEILEEMDLDQQIEIISKFKVNVAAKFIEEMEPDDAVDLLEELQETNEDKAEEIIKALPKKEQDDIRTLLNYEEESAGAIMTSSYIAIPENLTVKEVLETIKTQNLAENESAFYIFITTKTNKLIGYTTLATVITAKPAEKIKDLRNDYPITIDINDDQEEVAKKFQKYHMSVLPVINSKDKLMGVITVDDIVDVVVEEANEDILKLTGTSTDDEKKLFSGKIINNIAYRIPWLIITILGGIIASFIITIYSDIHNDSIFPLALSLSFIPLLMGLGGNVGNQSSAIIVRGLATDTYKQSSLNIILKELIIGIGIGIILALLLFTFNLLITKQDLMFASIVSISLLCNIIVATFIGTSLPLFFNKINIDPAIASAPFISTSLDIIGQLIYFTITLSIISNFYL